MTGYRHFDADAVRAGLDYPGCIAAVRDAMRRLSTDAIDQPLRQIAEIAPERRFALMPGVLGPDRGFGAKVISVYGDADRPGRSTHRGIVVLFDPVTGDVAATGDARAITDIRTACASAVATDALARPAATTLGIFGCGALAAAHIDAIPLVRSIADIVVWGRDPARTAAFVDRMATETGPRIRATADPADAAASDIVCTVTGSTTPVLLHEWVRPGTHVNLVGSSYPGPVEVDPALVLAGRYIADSRRSALAAAAEFLDAKAAGLIDDSHIVAEIGDVLSGAVNGRRNDDEVTLYKSLGHIVQDLVALEYLCRTHSIVSPD